MNDKRKQLMLNGKNILIVGSSSGIGRAIATSYAKKGAKLILMSRNINELESLYDSITSEPKHLKPYILPFDLLHSSWDRYENIKQIIEKEFSYLDGIVCNAGILGKLSPIEYVDIQDWFKVIQTNLNSNFMLLKCLIPLLKKAKTPVVIANTINNVEVPKAFWGAYSVSKSALNNLIQILSIENKKIIFHLVDPGKINTRLTRNAFPIGKINDLKKPHQITEHYTYLMCNIDKSYERYLYSI